MKSKLDKFTIIALILVICSIALTYGERTSWIGHALAGMTGIVLMIMALVFGAMMTNRIKKTEGNLYGIHKRASKYFGAFILGAFLYQL